MEPALKRKNLFVKTGSFVTQILIGDGKATGVALVDAKGNTEQLKAKKEIILSAGAIQTPQLLMLSGIGNQDYLAGFGIDSKLHLSGVGQNLIDHFWSGLSCWSTIPTDNHTLKPFQMGKALFQHLLFKKGPLGNSPLTANAFLGSKSGLERPDLQFHFAVSGLAADYSTDLYQLDTFPKRSGFSIMVILIRPESMGYVGLKSANPFDSPLIQPNFLTDERDLEILRFGMKKAKEVLEAQPLRDFSMGDIYVPREFDENSLTSHIKKNLETLYHPVGTCKMGKDNMSVVDENLKVRGISGLRIADASIMPTIISGNTNAACMMIGEKASDMILEK